MATYTEVIETLKEPTRTLRRAQPDVWKGFGGLHQAAMADGEVPARTKELVALAIAVIKECDGCIAYHASAAARKGATEAEVAEILSVALLMGGGPASVWALVAQGIEHRFPNFLSRLLPVQVTGSSSRSRCVSSYRQ